MGNGYVAPKGEGLEGIREEFRTARRRQRETEKPGGTALSSLVAQVQAALANLAAQVASEISAQSYTRAQIDVRIQDPGLIGPVSTGVSGRFDGGLASLGAYNELLGGSGGTIRALWIHPDGRLGYLPSDEALKLGMKPARFTIEQVLQLQAVLFRYQALPPYAQEIQPEYLGAMAHDVEAAGFPWLVDYDEHGNPASVHHAFGWLVVLEGLRDLHARFVEQDMRIARLERAMGLETGD